jgi:predicted enzyme related to lactoylglutathione lyase
MRISVKDQLITPGCQKQVKQRICFSSLPFSSILQAQAPDMNHRFLFCICLLTLGAHNTTLAQAKSKQAAITQVADTTPRVTGIGGIFFGSENPKATRQWYGDQLGLAISDYGSPFAFRNADKPEELNYLIWSPFKKGSSYMAPSKKEFMINYRVQHIEALVRKLKANGAQFTDTLETYDYGKFIHLMDPDGNKLELWEPVDSVLTQKGSPTTH